MSDPPTPLSMERGGKGKTAIPEEEKADEPSILPMTRPSYAHGGLVMRPDLAVIALFKPPCPRSPLPAQPAVSSTFPLPAPRPAGSEQRPLYTKKRVKDPAVE